MFTVLRKAVVAMAVAATAAQAETQLVLANAGFEQGAQGWSGTPSDFSRLSKEAAHAGEAGLRIEDKDRSRGSNVRSAPVTVQAKMPYAVRFWARTAKDSGVGVYVEFWDAQGKAITTQERRNQIIYTVPGSQTSWKQFTIATRAPEVAVALTIWIHSFNGSIASADLDDFSIARLTEEEAMSVKTSPTATRSGSEFRVPTKERIAEIARLLTPEPRGLWRPAADREAWDPLSALPSAAGVIKRAEPVVDSPPPEVPDELYLEFSRNGNRTNYQRPYGLCSTRVNVLVVAECLENKGRFLPALERDVLALCEHRSWVMPAHDGNLSNFNGKLLTVDLGSSARAWMLAHALYWLGDRISAATRERVLAEVRRRVLDPYLAALRSGTTRGNWWIRGSNNWNAVCNAGVVGTALALIESRDERAELIAGMEISNPYFLSGFTDDGYCSEGMGYWNYGFGHYLMLGIMVRDATDGKLDIFSDPKLPAIAAFPLNVLIQPSIAPAFADCSVNAGPSAGNLALIERVFPDLIPGDFTLSSPLAASILHTGFHAAGWREPVEPAVIKPEHLSLHSWFADAGILVSRDRPDAALPFSAAIKGGHNAEHHNHNDVGSFTIVLDGRPFLLDPGGEVYTRRTFSSRRYESKVLNSYGHPVPIVAGQLQPKGGQSRARILDTEFTDTTSRLVMDISDAYTCDALSSLVRTFVHDREARTMTIEDKVAFTEPTSFGNCLVTYSRVHREDDSTLVVYDLERALRVDVAVDGGEWEYAEEEIENPSRPSVKRLGFNLTGPVSSATVRFTVRPCELTGDLPGVYSEPVWEGVEPDLDGAVKVQAEDLLKQVGGEVTVCDKVGADGRAFKFWDKPGHSLSWQVDAPRSGRYAVQVRCCHASRESVTRQLAVDGQPVGNPPLSMTFPFTGGWSSKADDWRDVWLAHGGVPVIVELSAGRHILTLVNEAGGGLNLDWIKIVPVRP